MDADVRECVKAEFMASPSLSPVRILLATDAASQGIDLQRYCHRLVHYEIPWNPNRLEQRNGRIDRHGQPAKEVLIYHPVGAGFEEAAPGSQEGDLHFLWIAAQKVDRIRDDLGSVGPVIARQVEEAMLGKRRILDTTTIERDPPSRRALKVERDLRAEIDRLRERLYESEQDLHLSPATLERVVRVGLELAHQPALISTVVDRLETDRAPSGPVFTLPPLTGSWAAAGQGIEHPVTHKARRLTFDRLVAQGHDDVVHVHLGHRLVQQCLRLLRAEIWSADSAGRMSRVTARVVPDDVLDAPAVIGHGRLVITGSDGRRLHEELIAASGRIREGRFSRLSVGDLERALGASGQDTPSSTVRERLVRVWKQCEAPLRQALERRAEERSASLAKILADRAQQEAKSITKVLSELRRAIEAQLAEPEFEQLSLELPDDERDQLRHDVDALKLRLASIPEFIETETKAIKRRYADPEPRLFPAAVTFLVPRRDAAS